MSGARASVLISSVCMRARVSSVLERDTQFEIQILYFIFFECDDFVCVHAHASFISSSR